MSRNLSNTAITAISSQNTSEVFLVLLKITHNDLPEPILVVRNTEDIVSNSETYLACAFNIRFPAEKDGQVNNAQIEIDNVDRRVSTALRSISEPPTCYVSVILADSPDIVEFGPLDFVLRNVRYTATKVIADLMYEERLHMLIPGYSYDPFNFPGLF